jgi:hypothetical protein
VCILVSHFGHFIIFSPIVADERLRKVGKRWHGIARHCRIDTNAR